MKTFTELKLNKKITKDGLYLYKTFIIPKEEKDKILNKNEESESVLNINTDNDRYCLNRDSSIAVAAFNNLDIITDKLLVVMKLTINVDKEDPVLDFPTENPIDLDPQYDDINGIISATTRDRITSMNLELLEISNLEISKDDKGKLIIDKIDFQNLLELYKEY